VADPNRGTDHPLIRKLRTQGTQFSFFQAMRVLRRLFPEAAPVGHQGPVAREAVRLRSALTFAFATSDIEQVRELPSSDGQPRFEITAAFLGLYGTDSPLPTYFTEQLLFDQDEDSLQREFLDLFQHRLLSLFSRAWEKYRYDAQFTGDGSDVLSRRFLALLGLDSTSFPKDHRIPSLRFLGLAGLLTQVPRSADSLRGVLEEYFQGIPVHVEQCVSRWLPIPPDQRNGLGVGNCRLGRDLSLGERVQDRSCTFRVGLGPVGLQDFMSLLPCGDRMPEARELVDLVNGDGLDYEIELRLRQEEVPPLQLSGPAARLGWSSWLGNRPDAESRVRFLVKGWLHGRG
jgi:type VI secretion system protein ImpH